MGRHALVLARELLTSGVVERLRQRRRVRASSCADDRPPARLRAQPAARALRPRRDGHPRPGVRDVCPRHRVGHRGDPRGSPPGPLGPGAQGARGCRGRHEAGRDRVRGADGAARGGHLAQAPRGAARGDARDLPADPPVGLGRCPVPEGGRPRDVRARHDVQRVRLRLRPLALGGPGAALPHRRLPDAAPYRPRDPTAATSSRTSSSGSASWSGRPTRACSTSGRTSSTLRRFWPGTPRSRHPPDPSRPTSGRSRCSSATRCSTGSS